MKSAYLGIRKNKLVPVDFENVEEVENFDITQLPVSNGITLPTKMTDELAEEIGIHIGDGHLSKDRYRYKIFGNVDESEYYENFVSKIYRNLYGKQVKITRRKDNTIGFEFCSKSIWFFKTAVIGLQAGRKDHIHAPSVIIESGSNVLRSFIRGLFDTDGNVYFQSRYGYEKYYPVISFTSVSKELWMDVCNILVKLGFKIYAYKFRNDFIIKLYGYENILKYHREIGWHNSKHTNKFIKWKEKYPELVK